MRSLAFFLSLLWLAAGAHAGPTLSDVRLGGDENRTRIVIDSDSAVVFDWRVVEEAAPRLVVDLKGATWATPVGSVGGRLGQGLVAGLRITSTPNGPASLIADLTDIAEVSRAFALAPQAGKGHRVVIDLTPRSPAADRPAAVAARTPSAGKRIVVLDAGHGGKDPGAIGPTGLQEKVVTLASALELKARLEATGRYEVRLIRDADVFVELADRTEMTRDMDADLFISLHADAGESPSLRGASVYTLNERGEQRARRMRQSGEIVLDVEDPDRPSEVNTILGDFVQRANHDNSVRLARIAVEELQKAGPVLRNPHRHQNFYVLLNPETPVILVEMGFMTNRQDERLLRTEAGRRPILAALERSIDRYFAESDRLMAAR